MTGPGQAAQRRRAAQQLAAELALAHDDSPVCRDNPHRWRHYESQLENPTRTSAGAAAAAAAHLIQMCRQCPFNGPGPCQDLAQVGDFTGVAAGAYWRDGRPTHPDQTPRTAQAS